MTLDVKKSNSSNAMLSKCQYRKTRPKWPPQRVFIIPCVMGHPVCCNQLITQLYILLGDHITDSVGCTKAYQDGGSALQGGWKSSACHAINSTTATFGA
jgi:hypothetical protein